MIRAPRDRRVVAGLALLASLILPASTAPAWAAERPVTVLRARVGAPLRLSVAAAGIYDRRGFRPECRLTCDLRGPMLQAEIGTGGAQIAFGYGAVVADRKRSPALAERVYVGIAVKAAVVRAWDGAGLGPEDRWLVGFELEGTITTVNFSLAALRDASGAERGDWRLAGGLGWGF